MNISVEQDLLAISTLHDRLQEAENKGDAACIGSLMADDCVIMVPNYPIQEGKFVAADFVADVMRFLMEHFDRRIAYTSAEMRIIGDWAFDCGTFSVAATPKEGGVTEYPHGKYFWLYSRDGDGGWKLARMFVSLDEQEEENREAAT
jgi:ketosteroid isomerase-like protein